MDGWNTRFLLGWPNFRLRCYVSFREGTLSLHDSHPPRKNGSNEGHNAKKPCANPEAYPNPVESRDVCDDDLKKEIKEKLLITLKFGRLGEDQHSIF